MISPKCSRFSETYFIELD
ncbi:hypothetical protein V3C99_003444 [Haemonchus contortus]